MNIEFFKRLALFVVLLLAQGLVFNHIHLFDVATPLLSVMLVLHFRRNHPQWAVLVWSFVLGLCTDIFANTPGVAAASMTFVALLQPYLVRWLAPRDSAEDLLPSFRTLGEARYLWYVVVLVCLYHVVFFGLEAFSFYNVLLWLEFFGSSTALSLVLILTLEHVRKLFLVGGGGKNRVG